MIWLICSCSGLEKNVQSFSPVVIPFADSLKHCSDVAVKRSIACALERLSNDPYNCFLIHQHDALKVNCFINDAISILQRVALCKTSSPLGHVWRSAPAKLTGLILVEHGSSWWRLVTGAGDPIFRRQIPTSSIWPPLVRYMVLSCQLCLAALIANQLLLQMLFAENLWGNLFLWIWSSFIHCLDDHCWRTRPPFGMLLYFVENQGHD